MNNPSIPEVGGRSAKFALILLVIVYVFNFIDRQILTILAEDLKADLNISDSDIGSCMELLLQSFTQWLESQWVNLLILGIEKI